jgi:hypothetical protein
MTEPAPSEAQKDLIDFLREFQVESDRAAAVLGGAYLESRLDTLLRKKFVKGLKLVDELFSAQGGLSTFSSKIRGAYAVGLITANTPTDLHLVRRIRNEFAHKSHGLSFRTDKIAALVGKFIALDSLRMNSPKPFNLPEEPRAKFNLAVGILLLLGIEARIDGMPEFKEATGTGVLSAVEVQPT